MNLKDVIKEYEIELAGTMKQSSRTTYLFQLRQFVGYFGEDRDISTITAAELRRWRLHMIDKGTMKPVTINGYIAAARRLLKFCVINDFLPADPAAGLGYISKENGGGNEGPKAISEADFLKLLNYAQSNGKVREVAIILFLFGTGCRVSGLCRLELGDLDFDNGRAWVTEKGRGAGKSRWVYLDKPVIVALKKYLQERPTDQGDRVFVAKNGRWGRQGISRKAVYALLARYGRAAGVEGPCNPHSFRHSLAINMLTRGLNLSAVSQLLGHEDIQTTHRFYTKFEQKKLGELHAQYSPVADLVIPAEPEPAPEPEPFRFKDHTAVQQPGAAVEPVTAVQQPDSYQAAMMAIWARGVGVQ